MKLCECGCGNPAPIANRNRKKMGWIKGEPKRFISGHNSHGCQNPNWKGGVMMGAYKQQYKLIYAPGHPRCCMGNHVLEQILLAEKAMGNPLPLKVVVHHHTPDQLVVCENQAYHLLLHRRMRALKACGHASWRKCKFCKKYDNPNNLFIGDKPKGAVYHRACASENVRNRKAKKERG